MYSKVKTPYYCILCSSYEIQWCVFLVCAFELCVLEHLKIQVFIRDSERGISLSKVLHTIRKSLAIQLAKFDSLIRWFFVLFCFVCDL